MEVLILSTIAGQFRARSPAQYRSPATPPHPCGAIPVASGVCYQMSAFRMGCEPRHCESHRIRRAMGFGYGVGDSGRSSKRRIGCAPSFSFAGGENITGTLARIECVSVGLTSQAAKPRVSLSLPEQRTLRKNYATILQFTQ